MWNRDKKGGGRGGGGDLFVHKLNEMGQIVDKKGHRAWEMACGLQVCAGERALFVVLKSSIFDFREPYMGKEPYI